MEKNSKKIKEQKLIVKVLDKRLCSAQMQVVFYLMTDTLIKFCDVIIKNNHYEERWPKSLGVIADKVQLLRLGKKRLMKLIESDS